MNAKKILFPTDFSASSEAALQMATSLARDSGATLLIVHVQESPLAYGGGELAFTPLDVTRDLEENLRKVMPSDPTVASEHRLVMGDPADSIVRLADEENVDLIVMASHGRTGVARLLMGSVAEAVVRRAACPVLTCKQPAGVAAH